MDPIHYNLILLGDETVMVVVLGTDGYPFDNGDNGRSTTTVADYAGQELPFNKSKCLDSILPNLPIKWKNNQQDKSIKYVEKLMIKRQTNKHM